LTLDTGRNTVGKTYGWEAPPGANPFNHYVEGAAIHGGMFEMPIITHVIDNLWHGGYVDDLDLGDTFDTIVSLYPWERYPSRGETYAFEMYDNAKIDTDTIDAAVGVATDALNAGRKVLVHCQAGLNRSSLIVATILMEKYGMTADEAIKMMRTQRSDMVLCNRSFEQYLRGNVG
jgi:hypothetical protein